MYRRAFGQANQPDPNPCPPDAPVWTPSGCFPYPSGVENGKPPTPSTPTEPAPEKATVPGWLVGAAVGGGLIVIVLLGFAASRTDSTPNRVGRRGAWG